MIARITCAVELAKPLRLKCGLHLLAEASIKSDATRPKFARWLDELEAQLGLSGAAAIPLDRYLTELIADYLETKFPGNSRSVLTEVADDLRATGGALANAVLRRGTIVDDNTVSKIVTVSLALLSGSFGRLS